MSRGWVLTILFIAAAAVVFTTVQVLLGNGPSEPVDKSNITAIDPVIDEYPINYTFANQDKVYVDPSTLNYKSSFSSTSSKAK